MQMMFHIPKRWLNWCSAPRRTARLDNHCMATSSINNLNGCTTPFSSRPDTPSGFECIVRHPAQSSMLFHQYLPLPSKSAQNPVGTSSLFCQTDQHIGAVIGPGSFYNFNNQPIQREVAGRTKVCFAPLAVMEAPNAVCRPWKQR